MQVPPRGCAPYSAQAGCGSGLGTEDRGSLHGNVSANVLSRPNSLRSSNSRPRRWHIRHVHRTECAPEEQVGPRCRSAPNSRVGIAVVTAYLLYSAGRFSAHTALICEAFRLRAGKIRLKFHNPFG